MAKIPNAVKILRKISTAYSRVHRHERYRQTTDGRATAISERERDFTFANNMETQLSLTQSPHPSPLNEVQQPLLFSAHLYCDQTVAHLSYC